MEEMKLKMGAKTGITAATFQRGSAITQAIGGWIGEGHGDGLMMLLATLPSLAGRVMMGSGNGGIGDCCC